MLITKKHIITLISIISLVGYGYLAFALIGPGQTLDPVTDFPLNCTGPTDPNCVISQAWEQDLLNNYVFNTTSNVGIGTNTPTTALDVIGTIRGSNLFITGDATTVGTPTGTITATIDYSGTGYFSAGYEHNYRIYSYVDTPQGRVYSSGFATLDQPSGTPPAAPTNLIATQTCDDGCNYTANGWEHNYRIYSYINVGDQRLYSTSFLTLPSNFVDDNSSNGYDITVSWDAAPGVDGYRVVKFDPNYNGANYDQAFDITTTSFIDDGCGTICFNYYPSPSAVITPALIDDNNQTTNYTIELSWQPVTGADGYRVLKFDPIYNGYDFDAGYDTTATTLSDDDCNIVCFDFNLANVGQTAVYSNAATINGTLNLTGPIIMQGSLIRLDTNYNFGVIAETLGMTGTDNIFMGRDAGLNVLQVSQSNFLGQNAGSGATYASNSNFLGNNAGFGATDANNSNFLGNNAGFGATNAFQSNFFGIDAGSGATDASQSNFLGVNAGSDAANAFRSNFFGLSAGSGATNASQSNFLGNNAGSGATSASNSNFFGLSAGSGATNANNSNFLGQQAGQNATNAFQSNFFGLSAGFGATDASGSNFLGSGAGFGATSASNSNFLGNNAGWNATNANNSNFLGQQAGQNATNAFQSNFFGLSAGFGATNANNSNFFGLGAGSDATSAAGSNFLGQFAGQNATNASNSNFFGSSAGSGATSASFSNFLGNNAGFGAVSASYSNFLGRNAGNGGFDASNSNFLGQQAGSESDNAFNSNFLGQSAGENATDANNSNFLGQSAGSFATNANNSNFFGPSAGDRATNASHSFFVGENAGRYNQDALPIRGTPNAANSIFIGRNAAYTVADNGLDNTTNANDFSILLGNYTSTGGFENSIALGQRATNTASNQFMIGSTTRRIEEMVFNGGSGNTCSIVAGTGISCSSDERLKTNIIDLDNTTLDKLLNIQTVTYNWKEGINQNTQIGFIAQNINEYFPELVSTNHDGMLAVNYAGMTPVLTKAIQELDIKLTNIESFVTTTNSTFLSTLKDWLGDVGNGIQKIFAREIRTRQLCIEDDNGVTCLERSQIDQLLQGNTSTTVYYPSSQNNSENQESENNETSTEQNSDESPDENVIESEIENTEEELPGDSAMIQELSNEEFVSEPEPEVEVESEPIVISE